MPLINYIILVLMYFHSTYPIIITENKLSKKNRRSLPYNLISIKDSTQELVNLNSLLGEHTGPKQENLFNKPKINSQRGKEFSPLHLEAQKSKHLPNERSNFIQINRNQETDVLFRRSPILDEDRKQILNNKQWNGERGSIEPKELYDLLRFRTTTPDHNENGIYSTVYSQFNPFLNKVKAMKTNRQKKNHGFKHRPLHNNHHSRSNSYIYGNSRKEAPIRKQPVVAFPYSLPPQNVMNYEKSVSSNILPQTDVTNNLLHDLIKFKLRNVNPIITNETERVHLLENNLGSDLSNALQEFGLSKYENATIPVIEKLEQITKPSNKTLNQYLLNQFQNENNLNNLNVSIPYGQDHYVLSRNTSTPISKETLLLRNEKNTFASTALIDVNEQLSIINLSNLSSLVTSTRINEWNPIVKDPKSEINISAMNKTLLIERSVNNSFHQKLTPVNEPSEDKYKSINDNNSSYEQKLLNSVESTETSINENTSQAIELEPFDENDVIQVDLFQDFSNNRMVPRYKKDLNDGNDKTENLLNPPSELRTMYLVMMGLAAITICVLIIVCLSFAFSNKKTQQLLEESTKKGGYFQCFKVFFDFLQISIHKNVGESSEARTSTEKYWSAMSRPFRTRSSIGNIGSVDSKEIITKDSDTSHSSFKTGPSSKKKVTNKSSSSTFSSSEMESSQDDKIELPSLPTISSKESLSCDDEN